MSQLPGGEGRDEGEQRIKDKCGKETEFEILLLDFENYQEASEEKCLLLPVSTLAVTVRLVHSEDVTLLTK